MHTSTQTFSNDKLLKLHIVTDKRLWRCCEFKNLCLGMTTNYAQKLIKEPSKKYKFKPSHEYRHQLKQTPRICHKFEIMFPRNESFVQFTGSALTRGQLRVQKEKLFTGKRG